MRRPRTVDPTYSYQWRQRLSHNVIGVSTRRTFLHMNVALDDTKQVGALIPNTPAFVLQRIVVFIEGIVNEVAGKLLERLQ